MHHEKQNLHEACPAEGPYGFMDIIFDDKWNIYLAFNNMY